MTHTKIPVAIGISHNLLGSMWTIIIAIIFIVVIIIPQRVSMYCDNIQYTKLGKVAHLQLQLLVVISQQNWKYAYVSMQDHVGLWY